MGCWNETCGLTNLPIMCGENVVLVFLAIEKSKGYGCYSTDFAKPVGLPIFGEYDDYGRVVFIKNEEVSLLFSKINFIDDKDIPYTFTNLFDLQTDSDKLSVKTHNTAKLAKVMFKKIAWDSLIKQQSETIDYMEKYRADKENRSPYNIRQQFEKVYEDFEQEYPLNISLRDKFNFSMVMPSGLVTNELTKCQVDQLIELLIFDSALHSSRRCWQPMSGSGSQNSETYLQEFIASITLDLAEQLRKDQEEED